MKPQSQEEKDTILLAENHEKIKKIIQGEELNMLHSQGKWNELYHKMHELDKLITECRNIYWRRYLNTLP